MEYISTFFSMIQDMQMYLLIVYGILEKKPNNISVSKLQAILLLEADFNASNKIIFNSRMIPIIETSNNIPHKIVGDRQSQSALYIAINKKVITDIVNQAKFPYIIVSVNASNCFDRVAHPISTIICKHFGLPMEYISTFFSMI